MNERHRQSVTVSARTVDEAITEAERELGVPRDSLDITVITEGSKGFLGMRAENARILAMVVGDNMVMAPSADTSTAVVAPTSPPADTPAPRGASAAPPVSTTRAEVEDVGKAGATSETEGGAFELGDEYDDETPRDGADEPGRRTQQHQETAALAQDILENLLRHMNIQARVSVRTMSDPIVLDVETDNGGLIIGRRGETLSALQYLVNVLIGKRTRWSTGATVAKKRCARWHCAKPTGCASSIARSRSILCPPASAASSTSRCKISVTSRHIARVRNRTGAWSLRLSASASREQYITRSFPYLRRGRPCRARHRPRERGRRVPVS